MISAGSEGVRDSIGSAPLQGRNINGISFKLGFIALCGNVGRHVIFPNLLSRRTSFFSGTQETGAL